LNVTPAMFSKLMRWTWTLWRRSIRSTNW